MSHTMEPNGLSIALVGAGYSALFTVDSASSLMTNLDVQEVTVSRALAAMARTHSNLPGRDDGQTWNVENFVRAVNQRNPNINWTAVLSNLDHSDFALYDITGLRIIVDAWKFSQMLQHHHPQGVPFPVKIFFRPWDNVEGQLSVLLRMLNCPPDILDLAGNPTITNVIRPEHIVALHPSMRPTAMQLASMQLNCLEICDVILRLADSRVGDRLRALLDRLVLVTPELLLLALAQIQPVRNELQNDLQIRLLNIFLIGHANSALVLMILWHVHPTLLLEGFIDMYRKEPTSVSRILDLAQEAKILVDVLDADLSYFTLDLASLAGRRQHLNLEKWLTTKISERGVPFAVECINYLERKYRDEVARQISGANVPTLQMSYDVLRTYFRSLFETPLPPQETERLWRLIQLYKQLQSQSAEVANYAEANLVQANGLQAFNQDPAAAETEDLVRSYFERLYTKEISVEQFVAVLDMCQKSKDQRQIDFFSCTVHTLLDEARFFNQYPEDELAATGQLLGRLIENHFISYALLRQALKLILDALGHPPGTKLFNFGVYALTQFRKRLFEWPQYAMLLSKISGLNDYPMIAESIQSALQETTVEDQSTSKDGDSSLARNSSALLQQSPSTDVRSQPPVEIQEKIAFVINNLSMSNLPEKSAQLDSLLTETVWEWFAFYIVVKRVSIEPNNHELYSTLLDTLDKPPLNDLIIEETYRGIHRLLNPDSTAESGPDRSALRNLGSWLGCITLGKNKPIRHKDLSLKELLLEAYDQNRLNVAIPLTCKVLQRASESKIFMPPNPWLMSIMRLLAELYWREDLRLNLKFEIEILCRTLGLDLNELEPTNLLLERQSSRTQQAAGDMAEAPYSCSISPTAKAAVAFDAYTAHSENGNFVSGGGIDDIDVSPLLSQLRLDPAVLILFSQHPVAKMGVFHAISIPLKKIAASAAITAANIACTTTKHLILKDFATDADPVKLRGAAHAMAATLSGRFAVANCKDSLLSQIMESVQTQLVQSGLAETAAESIATTLIMDNSDLIDSFVEELAQVQAANNVERLLAHAYAARLRSQEQYPNAPFFDQLSLQVAPHNVKLPEFLRPSGIVTMEQMRVYDTFHQLPVYTGEPQLQYSVPETATDNSNLVGAKFEQTLTELDLAVSQCKAESFKDVPKTSNCYVIMMHLRAFVFDTALPLAFLQTCVEKVMFNLYQSASTLGVEVYTMLLGWIFDSSPEMAKETLRWLIYADDERKFNARVISSLILHGVIPPDDYDIHLAKLILSKADSVLDFAVELMQLRRNQCSSPALFLKFHVLTVAALDRFSKNGEANESVSAFLRDMREQFGGGQADTEITGLDMRIWLAEWIRICEHPLATDSVLRSISAKIMCDIGSSVDALSHFLRICVETCVEAHLAVEFEAAEQRSRHMTKSIDSVAKLIAFMIASKTGKNNTRTQQRVLSYSLSVIALVLVDQHEKKGASFDQRPFFRLLISLFSELARLPTHVDLINPFSDVLYMLRPSNVPGFAFSWLQLISHRTVISHLPAADYYNTEAWKKYHKLIKALLEFLSSLIQEFKVTEPTTQAFYRCTLRILVLLLHDFPEFLSYYCADLVSIIPYSCVQVRNVILSAFPRNMRLPDPSVTTDLRTALSATDYREDPLMNNDMLDIVKNAFAENTESFFQNPQQSNTSYFQDILKFLDKDNSNNQEPSHKLAVDSSKIGAFVLYIGTKAPKFESDNYMEKSIDTNPATIILNRLLSVLPAEGQYLLLCGMADQLRYPNSHTYFFRSMVLHLFITHSERVKECITRVLLERLIVNRPHPWGLLATFMELVSREDFWSNDFIRMAPDLEHLFDSVLRYIKCRNSEQAK